MLTIRIPSLPPKECSPNWRGHWAARNRAVGQAKDWVIALVLVVSPWWPKPIANPVVTVTWGMPDKRVRDYDNMVAMTKPYIDGLVAAGVIAKDDMRSVKITYQDTYSKGQPYTEMVVSTAEETNSKDLVA